MGALRTLCVLLAFAAPALGQRSLGIDVSAWQGNITQANWNTLRTTNNREFAFIRSSRGGTTGFYNQSDANNNQGLNTLSQRYDDPYFVQNITRATAAGMWAGPYHFSRPDIVASTLNSGGIANTGADEANHFLQMAGAWMRPGYLLPVFDLEAGDGIRTDAQITQFSIDFSNRIFEVTGVRPIMYINGNYAANVVQPGIEDAFPVLWVARYANQDNPDSIPVQTGHPKDTFSAFYGPWDDPPAPTHPWAFWQYASTARLSGYANGTANIDVNVAQGGPEFLKDNLVPALWVTNSSGDWSTLANWNSGQTPVAPVQGPGQVPRVGSLTLPATRLPGADDTVVLERSAASPTIALSTGTHTIRKLVAREAFNLTGGSLTLGYTPVAESTPYSALIAAPVTVSGGALSAHTLQVEPTRALTLAGGTTTFNTLNLMPGTTPGSLAITGNVTLGPLASATATIKPGTGSGTAGVVSLGFGAELTVLNGPAAVDVSIDSVVSSGTLVKSGPGTLRLSTSNTHAFTQVREGTLLVTNTTGNAAGFDGVHVEAGATLGGTGRLQAATVVKGTLAPGLSVGTLTAAAVLFNPGSTFAVEMNSAASIDRLAASSLQIDPTATIAVTLGPSFTPVFGTSYTIATTTGGVTGRFGTVTSSGPAMVARTSGTSLVLEVLSGLAGDFNNDGAVTAADFTVWENAYGGPASALLNTSGVGTVDQAHYTAWRDNLGALLPSTSAAVPEPAAAMLVGAALAAIRRRG